MNNIRDLHYLVAVADHGHFGRAAEACFVSQPTLSAQLKKLEEQLGVTLFERNNKHVLITPIGQSIVNQARLILQQCNQLKALADYSKDPFSGDLHIGIIATLGPYLLPHILKPLKHAFPKLNFIIHENLTEHLLHMLKQGELDVIIIALPIADHGFTISDLFYEPFHVALPNKHPLTHKKEIHTQELKNETVLLLSEGHCLRDQALEACTAINSAEKKGFQATSLETLRQLVAADYGITLLPALALSNNHTKIVIKPFADPMPSRRIGMLWRDFSARTQCYEKIKSVIIESVEKLPVFSNKRNLKVMKKNVL